MNIYLLLVVLIIVINGEASYRSVIHTSKLEAVNLSNTGDPLYLTHYIEANQTEDGRKLSKVVSLPKTPNRESYSGFLTVNKQCSSNMFFWFFPTQNKSAPILLWLQGGPGASSLFGNFVEIGPYIINKDLHAKLRKYSWNNEFSLLFIDNPVGTGFSFTNNCYVKNEDQVADALHTFLDQFFILFDDYKKNDFYIMGESYAGKYIPAIAYKILNNQELGKINLKGIAIGDGFSDPLNMIKYSDLLYAIGLFDSLNKKKSEAYEKKINEAIKNKDYEKCFYLIDELINGDLTPYGSLYYNATGLKTYFNFLETEEDKNYYAEYLNQDEVRKAIHVGNLPFNDGKLVEKNLLSDFCKSVTEELTYIMENSRVLLYNGQLDIIVAPVLTQNMLKNMNFSFYKEYFNSEKKILRFEDNKIFGYLKNYKQFYYVVVRNAGHMVPYNQPEGTLQLITKFIKNEL